MRDRPEPRVYLFAGPTLATSERARALARAVHLRPPVERTDIARLTARVKRPGVVVIVDGLFHEKLAVGHAEIRDALEGGWQVWGVGSMGAIRAREMAAVGMRGFGRVYERFQTEEDFQDDEVALLHDPSPPYRPLTEPLVHLRFAVDRLLERGLVHDAPSRAVLADLKSRWFGERTLRRFVEGIGACARASRRDVESELRDFDRFRIKTIDVEDFLVTRPWIRRESGRHFVRAQNHQDQRGG